MSYTMLRSHPASALALVAVLAAAPLLDPNHPAREPRTGAVEGHVRDSAGAPIANAQVFVVGTARNAQTDSAGSYRIANVPAGTITLRAAFVGYRPVSVQGLRILAGRTVRQDFTLEQSAVQMSELTVNAPPQPLVPRDEVATRQRLAAPANALEEASVTTGSTSTEYAEKMPVDRVGQVLSLQPGVSAGFRGGTEPARAAREAFNTEEYSRVYDNRFLDAGSNPLSTFSIDVDRASYSNVRRFLRGGALPPADAVRIEELVNYFSYDYAEPRGQHPFSVTTDVAPAPWSPGHLLVRIGLQGRRYAARELPPSNLVFLIDVSGSMQSPDKLPLVKQAFRLLVNELRPQDRVAIVVYAGNAGLVLPSTPGSDKQRILAAIDRLEAGGSTAGGAGIRLAYDVAREHHLAEGNNRVILATDGDFNVGTSSTSDLVRLIEDRRGQGTYLTVLGFGTGNYKDARMEQLADKGNGNFAYIDGFLEARKVFVEELTGTLFTIAKDVKIQVEFNPARVRSYRLVGYENRLLAKEDFADDTKDAGEIGAGHTVTALYEIVPADAPDDVAARSDSLRYQHVALRPGASRSDEWLTVQLRYKPPQSDRSRLLTHPLRVSERSLAGRPRGDFAFASAVAAFGMLLRDSEFRGSASFEQVLALATEGRGEDRDGYRAEFVQLVRTAQALRGRDVTVKD